MNTGPSEASEGRAASGISDGGAASEAAQPSARSANRPAPTAKPNGGKAERPAWRSPASLARFLGVVIALVAADLVIKDLAFTHVADEPIALDRERVTSGIGVIPPHDAIPVAPHLLSLKLTLNRGAIFGLGSGAGWGLAAVSFAATVLVTVMFLRSRATAWGYQLALGLVLAGATGNLYDRVVFGAVRDMFWLFPGVHLPFGLVWPNGMSDLYPWIFNLADAALLVGVCALMLHIWRSPGEGEARESGGGPAGGATGAASR